MAARCERICGAGDRKTIAQLGHVAGAGGRAARRPGAREGIDRAVDRNAVTCLCRVAPVDRGATDRARRRRARSRTVERYPVAAAGLFAGAHGGATDRTGSLTDVGRAGRLGATGLGHVARSCRWPANDIATIEVRAVDGAVAVFVEAVVARGLGAVRDARAATALAPLVRSAGLPLTVGIGAVGAAVVVVVDPARAGAFRLTVRSAFATDTTTAAGVGHAGTAHADPARSAGDADAVPGGADARGANAPLGARALAGPGQAASVRARLVVGTDHVDAGDLDARAARADLAACAVGALAIDGEAVAAGTSPTGAALHPGAADGPATTFYADLARAAGPLGTGPGVAGPVDAKATFTAPRSARGLDAPSGATHEAVRTSSAGTGRLDAGTVHAQPAIAARLVVAIDRVADAAAAALACRAIDPEARRLDAGAAAANLARGARAVAAPGRHAVAHPATLARTAFDPRTIHV